MLYREIGYLPDRWFLTGKPSDNRAKQPALSAD